MIDALIRWSLNNRVLVVVLAGALLAWGGYLLTTMPVDVLPDLTAPTVTILAEGTGMAPTEMESLVTFPIEAALNGASGVRRVRSATAVGVAIIWTEFDWGEDIYRARQTVTEKLNLARGALPPQVDVVLAPISSIMGEIVFIALESDRHSLLDLRTTADTVLRRRLLAVAGVSQVTPTGGGQKQYQVLLSPGETQGVQRLARRGGGRAPEIEREHLGRLSRGGRPGVPDPGNRPHFDRGRHRTDGGRLARRSPDPGSGPRRGANRRGAQAGRRIARREARRHIGHPEAARDQHAGTDPAPGRRAGRDPEDTAGGNDDRQAHLPPSRFHRNRRSQLAVRPS